ncbi:hypothetical protein C4580_04175 [Candidatus Woesearchaeota archaeon]|nr:MAG: hypothetical protein C4580_04175 [Candidatus Woesearchaeota archaeon]
MEYRDILGALVRRNDDGVLMASGDVQERALDALGQLEPYEQLHVAQTYLTGRRIFEDAQDDGKVEEGIKRVRESAIAFFRSLPIEESVRHLAYRVFRREVGGSEPLGQGWATFVCLTRQVCAGELPPAFKEQTLDEVLRYVK